jgi:uncharacterized protein YjbI with pentapeptide repeats
MQIFNKEGVLLIDSDNLCGADLRGADLHDLDLHGINLSNANLYHADLHYADLHDGNLDGAYLSGVNLCGVNLSNANLHHVYLGDANLIGTNFRDARLNWHSHTLLMTILRQVASSDLVKLSFVEVLEPHFDWLRKTFGIVDLPAKEWALSVLSAWPDEGKPDCVPRLTKAL